MKQARFTAIVSVEVDFDLPSKIRISLPLEISLPKVLSLRLAEYERVFQEVCAVEEAKLEQGTRYYYCFAFDQRLREHLLPMFCGECQINRLKTNLVFDRSYTIFVLLV